MFVVFFAAVGLLLLVEAAWLAVARRPAIGWGPVVAAVGGIAFIGFAISLAAAQPWGTSQ